MTRTLLNVPEQLVATPTYLSERGTPQSVDDHDGHEIFAWHRPSADPFEIPRLAGGGVAIRPVVVATDVHALRQLALSGQGMAFIPEAGFPDPKDPEPLVPVLPELGRMCPVNVVVPEALARSAQVRAFQKGVLAFLP